MIAIDTNVLVRFFAKDDRDAYSIAETLIAEGPVTISTNGTPARL